MCISSSSSHQMSTHTHTQPFAHCMCEQQSWLILTHSLVSLMLDAFECVHFNWNEFSWHPLAHPIIYIRVYEYMYFTFLHSALNPWCESIPLLAHINISWRWKSQMIEKWFLVTIFCAVPSSLALTLSSSARNNMQCIYLCVYSVSIHTERARARDHGHKTLYMRNKAPYVLN